MIAVSIREVQTEPDRVWAQLRESQNLVVTSEGRPLALLVNLETDDPEEVVASLRLLRARKAVERMRNAAAKRGLTEMTLDEINREIAVSRQESAQ